MRHHGDVASTCIHGFETGTCLICQTLGTTGTAKPVATEPVSRAQRTRRTALEPTSPRVLPAEGRGPRAGLGLRLVVLVIGAFILMALAWSVFHLVFAILRILELIAVAVAAAYVGYQAGVHHGRRTAPPPKRG